MSLYDDRGEPWGQSSRPLSANPNDVVLVKLPDANNWSAPLLASAVRWSDVVRWRYADLKAPTTPALAPLDTQVGGGHYKSFKIQPVEYIHANGLDYMQGNVVKYVSRHKQKNGAEDIRKAIHYLELILELQYADAK